MVVIIIMSLHHSWNTPKKMYCKMFHKSNTMGAISGPKTGYPSGAPEFISCFRGVRVCLSCLITCLHVFCFVLLCPLWFPHSHDVRTPNSFVGARVAQWVRSLDLTAQINLSPIRHGFAPGFVNNKKGALDSQPQVIRFTSCLPRVGGSLRVLRLPPPLKLVDVI